MRPIEPSLSRRGALALAIFVLVTGLAACTSSSSSSVELVACQLTSKPAPLALAMGIRSNVPAPSYPQGLASLLTNTANAEQQISLIRIDGQPKLFRLPLFSTVDKNPAARSRDVTNYLNANVNTALAPHGVLSAHSGQADLLTALNLAASVTGRNGNIIMIDSGLQTVAPLNYAQPGLLMSSPQDVVTFLRKKGLLPHLRGRHVLLSGFGYAAPPQAALNGAQRDNVIAQWEAIIKAGGGCAIVDQEGNTAQAITGLPAVSVVSLPKTPSFRNCGTIVLSDAGSVGFVVGSSTFRDPSAAHATLRKLAATLKQGQEHIKLIGSTSTEGGDAVNNPLSQHRADAVRSVLVSLGIAASRISAVGLGSHWPGRVPDVGPGGVLLPAQAEQDREVIVQLPRCK